MKVFIVKYLWGIAHVLRVFLAIDVGFQATHHVYVYEHDYIMIITFTTLHVHVHVHVFTSHYNTIHHVTLHYLKCMYSISHHISHNITLYAIIAINFPPFSHHFPPKKCPSKTPRPPPVTARRCASRGGPWNRERPKGLVAQEFQSHVSQKS